MRFKDKNNDGFFKGLGGGFEFTISYARDYGRYYVVASHRKKDIRLNTLWIGVVFPDFDNAVSFCENFKYKDYKCVGGDV